MTVYFAATTTRVKIGYTERHVRDRIADLVIGSSEPLRVIHTIDGADRRSELALQRAFAFARCRGRREWFDRAPVEAHIKGARDARAIIESLMGGSDEPAADRRDAALAALAILDGPAKRSRARAGRMLSVTVDEDTFAAIEALLDDAMPGLPTAKLRNDHRAHVVRRLIALGLKAERKERER